MKTVVSYIILLAHNKPLIKPVMPITVILIAGNVGVLFGENSWSIKERFYIFLVDSFTNKTVNTG